jgi:hypothetical protein
MSMGQHVPSRPVWLQDTHGPWQASVQHTPSVQKPEPHSVSFMHVAPFILRPQLPFVHSTPFAQSPFEVQLVKQACLLASHEYGRHTLVSEPPHVPTPSQVLMPVMAAPSQAPGWHTAPIRYFRQAPFPSHVPSVPQVLTSDLGQVEAERGARPFGTNVHVPIEPCTSQRLHVSPQAVSQQTPSMQKPDWQSLLQPQAWPLTTLAPASAQVGLASPGLVSPPV